MTVTSAQTLGSLGWWLVYVDVAVLAGTTEPLMMPRCRHSQRIGWWDRVPVITPHQSIIFVIFILFWFGVGVDCSVYISSLF